MNIATVFHNIAMEFADKAILASSEKKTEASRTLFEKAYLLEKEAADQIKSDQQDSKALLLGSAASLALKAGNPLIALELIEEAMSYYNTLGEDIQMKLSSTQAFIIENTAPKESKNHPNITVIGFLTSADASKRTIELRDKNTNSVYKISVPSHLINTVVKEHWANIVQIEGHKTSKGEIILDKITQAA